jgi:hypothetical protein
MLKPIRGVISVCECCGEQAGYGAKYCATCRTKDGRQSILNANIAIAKENLLKGYKVPEL